MAMKTNQELQQDVMEEIKWDPLLCDVASEIGVTANDGVVTLSGLVSTYGRKRAAELAAQRVAGVTVVAVEIDVKVSTTHQRSDIEIAQAVRNALKWHSAVNEDLIEVKVDKGVIYLDGTAEWDYQRRAAEFGVRDLVGVRGVVNRILVKSKGVEPKEIKGKIAAAFHRSATVDSANLHIDVNGSRVVLNGKVRSWAERLDAENAAWSSPGVASVENKIEVDTEIFV
jgi:osmotically-inducible protein OsmY